MKKTLIATAFFILINTHAFAACSGTGCTNTIDRLLLWSDGNISIDTSGTETNLTNCTPEQNKYIHLPSTHPNRDEIYAFLLSSKMAEKTIYIRTKDTPGADCEIKYTLIDP